MADDSMSSVQKACERVLGISFFDGTVEHAVEHHRSQGGYAVIPAAPALIKLNYDEEYRRAMQSADLAIADSGLLVLLWRLATGRKLRNISGISYFKELFERGGIQAGETVFWVFASNRAKEKALEWLVERGLGIDDRDCFVTVDPPSAARDYAVLVKIEERKQKHIVIAMAGGGQEKLALYLRDYLLYRPSIHCIGA
ncbi:MAG: N-acetylglucosaminyldiphosphoundecaprenol N-acetyl-beta-D-mannosaminyltransferase, partial [Verrucomicrobiota bacterium]